MKNNSHKACASLPLPLGEGRGGGAQLRKRAGVEDAQLAIAGSLPLPLGEDRGEGAQCVAEILEA